MGKEIFSTMTRGISLLKKLARSRVGNIHFNLGSMQIKFIMCFMLAIAFSKFTAAVEESPSGEKIYKEVCFACHAQGVANAPKLGDKAAWGKLIAEGQVIITAHGYVGIRAMPPRGGKEGLSVEQFSKALNYMVSKSGGQWGPPDKDMIGEINKEITRRKNTQ